MIPNFAHLRSEKSLSYLMLTKVGTFIFVLSFVFLATPLLGSAQTGAANGNFKFIMEDGLTKSFEFDAVSNEKGGATGFMQFNDEAKLEFQDLDGTGDIPKEEPVPFTMKASLEAMTIEKNRAIINGVI